MRLPVRILGWVLLGAVVTTSPVALANPDRQLRVSSAVAIPDNATVPFATYRIVVDVGEGNVEQLGLEIPKSLRVSSGIVVKDGIGGQGIPVTLTQEGTLTVLRFGRPLIPRRQIAVYLQGVRRVEGGGQVWILPLHAQTTGQPQWIQVDTAIIRTHLP
jgi:hypothetical protein